MNQTEGQIQKIGEIIRKRRRLVAVSSIPFSAFAAVALLSRITSGRFLGIPFSIAGPVFCAVFLATLVLHILVWRCPACRAYLGLVAASRFCPKCGIRFNAKPDE
jgi:hypothetical protein